MPYEHLDSVDIVRSHCDCQRRQPFVRRVDCSVTWRMASRYVEARERLVDVDVLVEEQQVLGREIVRHTTEMLVLLVVVQKGASERCCNNKVTKRVRE